MKWTSSCAVIIVLWVAGQPCFSALLPKPTHYVQDGAGVIDDRLEIKLNGYLAELEQKTTAQVLVLTVSSTDGIPITSYALQISEAWQLGQKGKDNGLLMVFAIADRQLPF